MAPLLRGPRQTGRLLGASATAVYVDFDTDGVPRVLALLPPTSVRLPLGMVVGRRARTRGTLLVSKSTYTAVADAPSSRPV